MIEYLLILAVVLIVAKILGELCERIGIPSILGEIGTGILLGPTAFGLISNPNEAVFQLFAEIGIIMLLFVAGFEYVDIKSVLKYKRVSITLSLVSSFIPLIGVTLWGLSMGYNWGASLLLGIALSATSMGITVRSLLDCNQINSKPGRTILGSLVLNDITGLILMTIVLGVVGARGGDILMNTLFVMGGIGVFFLLFLVAEYIMPYVILYSIKLRVEEAQFTLVFVVVLLTAFLAQNLGLSTMIGAFFAGVFLSRSSILETETFSQKISSVSYGLFIPLFFVMAGARMDLSHFSETIGLALMMLTLITSLQIGSAFVVGRLYKYKTWESIMLGLGMLPYGEVTLIVMTALLTMAAGNIERFGGAEALEGLHSLFSAVLILIAMTVVIAPLTMRFVSRRLKKA